MNDQCNNCKIRKMCYREEPEGDWTCDHYEPDDDLLEETEEEENGTDTIKLLKKLLKNNDELLESNQRLITLNEQLVEVNNGWNDLASKMFALLTKPTEGPKRGKWVTDIEVAGEKGVGCDQCKTFFAYNYGGKKHNFCPQCGADMREEST